MTDLWVPPPTFTPGWRARVRDEALAWVGTPYHPRGMVRGPSGGCDCVTLVLNVFAAAGVLPAMDPPWYDVDEPFHVPGDRYVQALLRYAVPVSPPYASGDVVMARLPGAASVGHAAVCIGPDEIVHAYGRRRGVVREVLRRSLVWRWHRGVYGVRGVAD